MFVDARDAASVIAIPDARSRDSGMTLAVGSVHHKVVTLKARIAFALVFLLIAGIAPVFALFHEHGERAGRFIQSGPHIFFFGCFVAPIAVAVFAGPLIRLARSCIPVVRASLLLLAMVAAGAACWFDYAAGFPQLFEFEHRVQDDARYKLVSTDEKGQALAAPTLWEFYDDPQKFSVPDPSLKDSYTRAMRKLASEGMRSPAVVIPYYIAMYVQILFALLYSLALVLVISPAMRSDAIVDQLFVSGLFWLPWIPAQQAFLRNKGMLYAGKDATSIILGLGLVVLLVYSMLYGLMSEERKKVALPQITFGGLILVVAAIPEVSGGAWELFSRDAHPSQSIILFGFVMGLFLTAQLVTRFASSPGRQSDRVDKNVAPQPEPPVSSATAAPAPPAKKRPPRKRR
jgi:hypothetical protein